MNYAQAKTIAAEHAPDLILDPEVPGQAHICLRARKDGPPFSIMLPNTENEKNFTATEVAQAEAVSFVVLLEGAAKHLLGKGE